jgi:hypothetical protein
LSLDPGAPVLLSSGLVEARDPMLLGDARYRSCLSWPLIAYPVLGRIVLLPDLVEPGAARHLERLTDPELQGAVQVVLLAPVRQSGFEWVCARAAAQGFTVHSLGDFGDVAAVLLRRSIPGPGARLP